MNSESDLLKNPRNYVKPPTVHSPGASNSAYAHVNASFPVLKLAPTGRLLALGLCLLDPHSHEFRNLTIICNNCLSVNTYPMGLHNLVNIFVLPWSWFHLGISVSCVDGTITSYLDSFSVFAGMHAPLSFPSLMASLWISTGP